ncbi:MAG TPA: PDGLE domain-containing protein [Candidatus Limnocylindria bacterium]|nr:PDGLE domain-containing protein [Candidatus Limnocylindria bacterium]
MSVEPAGEGPARRSSARSWLLAGLAISVLVVLAAAWWASGDPDGLERVAVDLGFIDAGQDAAYEILPDYTLPGLEGAPSTVGAGLVGIVVVLGLMLLLGRLLARRRV